MQTLSESVLSGLSEAELKTYDLSQLPIDADRARRSIRAEVSELFDDLNADSARTARCARFRIPDSTPDDFAEHLLPVAGAGHALCGIRHANLNPELPFVALKTDFPLSGVEAVAEVYAQVEAHFRVFRPRWVAVTTRRPIGGQLRATWMVQHARAMQARGPWPGEAALSLEQVSSTDYYAWYRAEYEAFLEAHPHLVDLVSINDLSVMEQSREAGLLHYLMLDGARAGLIAAERSDFLGHPGLYFNELYLTEAHRGRGLAKALQRRFVAECCPGDAFVWGTIDADNQASYRTARANGRLAIRCESFVPVGER